MVVDTAHIVAVAAQSRDDLDEARWASEIAVEAAPYDEISRLDLVKVATAQGHNELAERMLDHDVFNRSDDYLGPGRVQGLKPGREPLVVGATRRHLGHIAPIPPSQSPTSPHLVTGRGRGGTRFPPASFTSVSSVRGPGRCQPLRRRLRQFALAVITR